MRRLSANDRCGICGGHLAPQHAPTVFATLAEALPALRESERRNIESRRLLDAAGLTKEPLDPRAGSGGKRLSEFP